MSCWWVRWCSTQLSVWCTICPGNESISAGAKMNQQPQGLTGSWILCTRHSEGAVWFCRNQDKLHFILKLWAIQIPYLYYQQKAGLSEYSCIQRNISKSKSHVWWAPVASLTPFGRRMCSTTLCSHSHIFLTFLDFPFSCYLVQLVEYSCWGCFSAATLPSFPALLFHSLCGSRDIINPINFELWPSLGNNTSLPSHWDISTFPKYFSLKLHFLWWTGKFKSGKLGIQACVKQCQGVMLPGKGSLDFQSGKFGPGLNLCLNFFWHSVRILWTVLLLLFLFHWCILLCPLVYFCYCGKLWGHFCDH